MLVLNIDFEEFAEMCDYCEMDYSNGVHICTLFDDSRDFDCCEDMCPMVGEEDE